MFSDRELFR